MLHLTFVRLADWMVPVGPARRLVIEATFAL